MEITVSVTKSSYQNRGRYYLRLTYFFFTMNSPFLVQDRKFCDRCFPQQIRTQTTVQLGILQDHSNMGIDFNMNHKRHPLHIVYTMLV